MPHQTTSPTQPSHLPYPAQPPSQHHKQPSIPHKPISPILLNHAKPVRNHFPTPPNHPPTHQTIFPSPPINMSSHNKPNAQPCQTNSQAQQITLTTIQTTFPTRQTTSIPTLPNHLNPPLHGGPKSSPIITLN